MTGSDVVSRLLAAIDEPEKAEIRSRVHTYLKWRLDGSATDRFRVTCRHCDWVAVGPESDVGPRADEHAVRCVSMPISPVLRLCQAHRDIVDEWQKRKQMADQLASEGYAGAAEVGAAVVAGLWAAVTLLARGYGVEDGED